MESTGRAALCITGMHRSGTSLVASWLQRCGLPIDDGRLLGPGIGNLHGHFEDHDFYDIARASVTRQHGSWRVVKPGALRFDAAELAQARALLAARDQRFELWGWKDPRALLFFEQWKQLAPGLKALVLWRPCTEVVQSLCKRAAADRTNPDFAISAYQAARVWRAYNQAALEIKRAHPQDVLLVSLRQVLLNDGKVIAHLQKVWGLKLSHAPIAEVQDQALLQSRSSLASRVVARIAKARVLERTLAAREDRLI
jgi:hypothetical protein